MLILMDLEFTCWEGSLASKWEDPVRPPEVLAIGLAVYDLDRDEVGLQYRSWVRPAINPELSAYCCELLGVSQDEIDRARTLGEVVVDVADWIGNCPGAAPTCSWGNDRRFLAADVTRQRCRDPFFERPHINLMERTRAMLGWHDVMFLDRDAARAELNLPPGGRRHQALDDAIDLVEFCRKLREWDGKALAT